MTDMPIDSPEIPPAPTLPGNGSQELISQVSRALDKAYEVSISEIDDMITRLGNLKETLKAKNVASQDKMQDFLGTIGKSLETLIALDKKIQNIEENHL